MHQPKSIGGGGTNIQRRSEFYVSTRGNKSNERHAGSDVTRDRKKSAEELSGIISKRDALK